MFKLKNSQIYFLLFPITFLISCSTTYKSNDLYSLHKNISYITYAEGKTLNSDIWVPKTGVGPFPSIVVVHGGGWTKRTRADMNEISEEFVKRGFVVMNISYRLAPKTLFPGAIIDYLKAVQWLRNNAKNYNVNPQQIGTFGYSAGAHIVSLGSLLRVDNKEDQKIFGLENLKNSKVQAVVAGGSPMDIEMSKDSGLVQKFLGKKYEEDPGLYKSASPIVPVHPNAPPFFIYHGQNDWIVEKEHMDRMVKVLDSNKIKYKTYVVPVIGLIATFLWSSESIKLSSEFFKENLK